MSDKWLNQNMTKQFMFFTNTISCSLKAAANLNYSKVNLCYGFLGKMSCTALVENKISSSPYFGDPLLSYRLIYRHG